ncbi:MAG: SAM-dependent methyltransferase [Bacteroidales bacterium]|nr:SAM-dependent methyltransferase [Bacteroidales bacterium]
MTDEATWQFIDAHIDEDVNKLALQKSKFKDIDFEFAIRQIHGRQKTRDKLPYFGNIPRFVYPPSLALEQCSSEITARYKREVINDIFYRDSRPSVFSGNALDSSNGDACPCVSTIADLTGGFGIDTLSLAELLPACHYVEPQQQLCDMMAYNSRLLQLDHIQVHQTTMEDFLQEMEAVDVIYADPSRRDTHGSRVVGLEDCSPNILLYKDILLRKSRLLMLKLSPMLDIKRALAQLPETIEVHVVAVDGECKELLFLLEKDKSEDVKFMAVNLKNDQCETFSFMMKEEVGALPTYAKDVKKYLYEPNAAILKAGAFKSLALRYRLEKLHPHTHLYTSDIQLETFPGRCFQVAKVLSVKDALRLKDEMPKANVSVRNFPLSAEELRKKLKLADGGEVYLYGTTMEKDRKVVILCRKFTDSYQL